MNYVERSIKNISTVLDNILGNTSKSIPVKKLETKALTSVDSYWGEHTVNSTPFTTAEESLTYLKWRSDQYPLFQEFMELYGQHDNQVVLDYGCGPGNDLVGFLVHSQAKKVIGIDISEKALNLARQRLGLHKIDPQRIELIRIADSVVTLPINDHTVDYIYCEGVLHHTSNPQAILKEFYRILKPASRACIMVYNYHSLWLHLYTAYQKMILEGAFSGMDIYEAFSKNTDGEACPIARCYTSETFGALCQAAGFQVEFIGGYFALHELKLLAELGDQALQDERLADQHKEFLRSLVHDEQGYPLYQGKHAGVGGVYMLSKA